MKRRDGTVVEWPNFVIGAKDPAAPAALRAYAEAAHALGFNLAFVEDVRRLADHFDAYRARGRADMRLNYADEEERPGQFALWDANCRRSIRGKVGQRELRELEAALLALPEKRLIKDALRDGDGGVCAIGCYAKHKGVDLSKFDPEDESDDVGVAAGMPHLVAWAIVALNDITLDTVWEVAHGPVEHYHGAYKGGIPLIRDMTPEERYERVLAWVREKLQPVAPVEAGGPDGR